MTNKATSCFAAALLIFLAGCGGSGSGNGSNPSPDPNASAVDGIFGADPGGDSTAINDADALSTEIDNIFGAENAAPVDVNPGDSISDVLNRARNG